MIQNPAGLRRYNSLPHPSFLPPALWMSWEANEGEGGGKPFYTAWGSLPPPAGRQAPCRPVEWRQGACRPAGGRQAPAKGFRANNFFLIYI